MGQEAELLARGKQLLAVGEWEAAAAHLEAIPEGSPARHEAVSLLAPLYLQHDQPAKAEEILRAAMRLRRDPKLLMRLGEALIAQEKYLEAKTTFEDMARKDPQNPDPWIMLGHCAAAQGRYPEAIAGYEQAILRDTRSATARYYLADVSIRANDIVRATGQLHYLLQREPNYMPAILLLGDISFHQKDFRQAAFEYCRAIALEVPGADVYERLGHSFAAIGDPQQALKAFDSAITADQACWSAYLAAARLCESQGWLKRARPYFLAIAFEPDFKAEAAAGLARLDEALARFDLGDGSAGDEPEGAVPGSFVAPGSFMKPDRPVPRPTTPFRMQEGGPSPRARQTQPLDPSVLAAHQRQSRPIPEKTEGLLGAFKKFLLGPDQPPR